MIQYLRLFFFIGVFGVLSFSCNFRNGGIPANEKPASYNNEQYRPQYHFSPDSAWMNDPNGMFFLDGEYHLFYQYYPDSTVWGPMHWGHAVSKDMIKWQHLPVALYPDSLGYIFSGSAVVDTKNSSGLGTIQNPPVVAIYTYHNPVLEKKGSNVFQNQGIAYSTDKGRTWVKYPGNPVLKNPGIRDFRDPKVIWHNATNKWIMILAVQDRVHIYSSPDLLDWRFESEFGKGIGAHGGVWECPDLFEIKVTNGDNSKWVMFVSINPGGPDGGSATQYFTGDFDGHKFIPDNTNEKWVDRGRDNYAGVTWSNIPESDGRRLFIGWMSNWDYANVVPTIKWRSATTVPREISLLKDGKEYILYSNPVQELVSLRNKVYRPFKEPQKLEGDMEINTDSISMMQCEMVIDFNLIGSAADSIGIILENNLKEQLVIGYTGKQKQIFVDRTRSGRSDFSGKFAGISSSAYEAGDKLKFRILMDASSSELFVDNGKLVMTNLVFPTESYIKLKVFSKGEVTLENAVFYSLKSIWQQ
ncbi:MAG: glycoside hydrolase family 32 protein [Bacteroidales bacterium]|nr:glycoside hydrolase family 32 protein [Bacteroidales bacterium]